MNKLQTRYLCQNNANDRVHHISKKIAIIKIVNVSKQKKSRWLILCDCFQQIGVCSTSS